MRQRFRCALPILTAALAFATCGCGSKDRSPTSPTGVHPPAAGNFEGLRHTSAVAPPLGAAATYGVIAASTVTNTGATVVTGDLGVSPGSAVTGFPPGVVTGAINAANGASFAAQGSATTAYGALAGQACNIDLTGQNLGGLTLTPGVYCFSSSAQLTGTLTLNGLGNPGSVWVFQIASTLTTASGSRVAFTNGAQACGTFWQVGSSATLGTGTGFAGNIFALASITLNTGASSTGALFASTAAVTLDGNAVSVVGSCGAGPQPSPTPLASPPAPPVPAVPQAAMLGLLVILLATGAAVLGRR